MTDEETERLKEIWFSFLFVMEETKALYINRVKVEIPDDR